MIYHNDYHNDKSQKDETTQNLQIWLVKIWITCTVRLLVLSQ